MPNRPNESKAHLNRAKQRLDESVLRCTAIFAHNQATLMTLSQGRADSFASRVARYIAKRPDLKESLLDDDLLVQPHDKQKKLVEGSLRRLHRQHKLSKGTIMVPVLLGYRTPRQRVEYRQVICYQPSTVLDALADV